MKACHFVDPYSGQAFDSTDLLDRPLISLGRIYGRDIINPIEATRKNGLNLIIEFVRTSRIVLKFEFSILSK